MFMFMMRNEWTCGRRVLIMIPLMFWKVYGRGRRSFPSPGLCLFKERMMSCFERKSRTFIGIGASGLALSLRLEREGEEWGPYEPIWIFKELGFLYAWQRAKKEVFGYRCDVDARSQVQRQVRIRRTLWVLPRPTKTSPSQTNFYYSALNFSWKKRESEISRRFCIYNLYVSLSRFKSHKYKYNCQYSPHSLKLGR